uniref:CSON009523 protein n=1 Tax=Culicoides sonorensis TaxID=179676 RepID=A0A336LPR9_CULSO
MYHYDKRSYPGSSYIDSGTSSGMLPMSNLNTTASKMAVPQLNTELVARAISYHGLPLQKMWEGERGENDLQKQGLGRPDYSVYQMRQKYLTFQDRAKRLRLHQFISKKADDLFNHLLLNNMRKPVKPNTEEMNATVPIPPYEVFLNVDAQEHDPERRRNLWKYHNSYQG